MHRKSKVRKTHQLIKNSLMKFIALIGTAISFRYLPFFYGMSSNPSLKSMLKSKSLPDSEGTVGMIMSSLEEGENEKKKVTSILVFFVCFKPVTSQRCFDWIQKSGQLIKLMHCRDPQNS